MSTGGLEHGRYMGVRSPAVVTVLRFIFPMVLVLGTHLMTLYYVRDEGSTLCLHFRYYLYLWFGRTIRYDTMLGSRRNWNEVDHNYHFRSFLNVVQRRQNGATSCSRL